MSALLDIKGLDVSFPTRRGTTYAVRDVALTLKPGEILGLVGESGAGKSTVGNAIVNLLEPPGEITAGEIMFQGMNLRDQDAEAMRNIRAKKLA